MFERIYPKAISWLSIAAFIPLSGLPGNSVSKSGHWQPCSIITTNPIHVSLEFTGQLLRGKLGPFMQLHGSNQIYSFSVSLLKLKNTENLDVNESTIKSVAHFEQERGSPVNSHNLAMIDIDGQIRVSWTHS